MIIAINKYTVPDHNLNGCRNDATAFLEYLREHGKEMGYAVDACVLTDSQATRKALIENFLSHFGQLEKGDTQRGQMPDWTELKIQENCFGRQLSMQLSFFHKWHSFMPSTYKEKQRQSRPNGKINSM
ncbi:MAG: hypothetical protein AAFV95_27115 [Bacteroidota bacterium]